jgi:hypothetical protein
MLVSHFTRTICEWLATVECTEASIHCTGWSKNPNTEEIYKNFNAIFHLNCTGTCSEPQGHTEINSSVAYSFTKIIPYSLPYSTQCTRGTGNPSTVIINSSQISRGENRPRVVWTYHHDTNSRARRPPTDCDKRHLSRTSCNVTPKCVQEATNTIAVPQGTNRLRYTPTQ